MRILSKSMLVGVGIAASALVLLAPASAQYNGRGYERDDRYRPGNIEAQKRAIRAQREQQRHAMRGGYYGPRPGYYPGTRAIPSGNAATGGNGGPGGNIIQQGPYGNFAVPVQPGNNNGNN